MKQLYCKTLGEWRSWLRHNHLGEDGVWLIFFKRGVGEQSLDYRSALDEALCFGWIDSLIKRIDAKRYVRKFTPRGKTSKWSAANKRRVEQLIRTPRMTRAGCAVVEAAKANGQWDKPDRPTAITRVPEELQTALARNRTALDNFGRLAPSLRRQYIMWVAMARRQETKEKRVREAVRLLEKGQELGLR